MKTSIYKNMPKANYNPPFIRVELIALEHGFAAASATVTPVNSASQVREEWDIGTDVLGDQIW